MSRVRRFASGSALALLVLLASGAWWARAEVRGSLARLSGQTSLPGLTGTVTVERDSLGIPTIRGASRADVARATGFVHAQDRFFQMDLARRRAAGELAALVGERAVPVDREIRIHRFRDQARRATALLQPDQARLLSAYVDGVNEGLRALESPPFEYLLLRQPPEPWRSEDSLLVVLSMYVTLQESDGSFESTLATMHEVLPPDVFAFLMPQGTEWDTPIGGDPLPGSPVPQPDVYDLRRKRMHLGTIPRRPQPRDLAWRGSPDIGEGIGSNNWVVAGRLATNGGAIVANDMHLGIRVPNTWYRAMLEWTGSDGTARTMIGVTLPGMPALVVGSNTHVAWGFTNTYADTSDIVMLDVDPSRPGQYLTPDGWRTLETHTERITVSGGDTVPVSFSWTIWGPVLSPDFMGRPRAYRWSAHSAERLAAGILPLEDARTVDEALDEVARLGPPAQNIVVADRSGRIGWSIYGSLPRREGLDGQLPGSWSAGDKGWSGWLAPAEYPRIVDPFSGRLWTANARVVDGEMLARLGDGNWEVGSRARVIRDRLLAQDTFTPRDMLAIQLDTRAVFLERWRQLILDTLTPAIAAGSPAKQAFRDVVDHAWSGEAATDSAAYRLTRMFRDNVSGRVFDFVLAECYEQDPAFDYSLVRRREGPLWALVTATPMHLLDPAYASWNELLVAAVDRVIDQLESEGAGDLRSRVWSQMNVSAYRHPLSAALPLLGRWLDMPARPIAGDLYTPRVQWRTVGASERMVVSPGREAEGIMHMPTGQSGHPLSPFYANSHEAWVEGRPTPFLPGTTQHTLVLIPPGQS
jgi:penicillin amidase